RIGASASNCSRVMVDVSKAPPVLPATRSAGSCHHVWVLHPGTVGNWSRAWPNSGWLHRQAFWRSICVCWSDGGHRVDNHPTEFRRERLCNMARAQVAARGLSLLATRLNVLRIEGSNT